MARIKILADSTCDLSPELVQRYEIGIIPLHIILQNKSYLDGVEITPPEIYEWADANGTTPKTSAPNLEWVIDFLRPYRDAGDTLICFGISQQMSSSCQVMRLAAQEMGIADRVYVVDSMNLSTGIGLQVIKAAELAAANWPAKDIVAEIEQARGRVRASFVVDTLTYLHRGGRCGAVTALVGNVLRLKPRIEVVDGKMGVGKKYRGPQDKVVLSYVQDMEQNLLHAETGHVFITHSGIDEKVIKSVTVYLKKLNRFKEIHVTRAGGVVSSHCGYGTLGVLYYMEK